MPKTAEVEKYRLTPEQVSFQKRYKLLKQKQALLEGATMKEQEKIRTLRSLWGELTGEFDALQVPQAPTVEQEGMDEGTEPAADSRWEINY